MPEFIMPLGSSDDARTYKSLSSFEQGFIEAMFFTDTGTCDDDELRDATFAELAGETLDRIKRDCEAFQTKAAALLDRAYATDQYDETQAGRDFWFSRNGHGVGYWDRDALKGEIGDRLHAAAISFSQLDLYFGDDCKLYLS